MSLAVKYRPKDFGSMVWQTFIKETLQEAVKENKLVWAYLFCGPRWTGKTSTARILAKAMNCYIHNLGSYWSNFIDDNLSIKLLRELWNTSTDKEKQKEIIKNITNNFYKWESLDILSISFLNKIKESKLNFYYDYLCNEDSLSHFDTIKNLSPNIPCNHCSICEAINNWSLTDIIEIDAASHTWVDNIRDIIEKAQFLPNKAKYKVYIIDEVHMLSTWAFNALLKILEEPPSFVKFILATTESHKIPETILSRCQRYDFKNISEQDIKERLEFIAKEEKIKTDDKAIDFIVKNSHWWLRNAITLFEQFIINDEIKFENITENLGITENSFVSDFLDKLINKDISVVKEFDKIIENWKNIKLFFKDLIYTTRDEIIKNIADLQKVKELNNILEILDETYTKTKNSMDEKITLLSGILKIITKENNFVISSEVEKYFEDPKSKQNKNNVIPKEQVPNSDIGNDLVNHDDILDIFWWAEETQVTQKNDSNFSKDSLIAKIKELWGKWGLTMGLRWWDVSFDWTVLNIKAPSKIALKSIEESWSNDVILEAMENLWFKDVKIKIH